MRPSGQYFGLIYGLLEFAGGDIAVSHGVLECISRRAGKCTPAGEACVSEFWEVVVPESVAGMMDVVLNDDDCPQEELDAFFDGLKDAVFNRLKRLAERTRIGRESRGRFDMDDEFMKPLCAQVVGSHEALFEICCSFVSCHLIRYEPESLQFAELLTLFLLDLWSSDGTLKWLEDVANG